MDSPDLADVLTEAARTLNAPTSSDGLPEAIVRTALRCVPGFDHAGLSVVHRDTRVETVAETDRLVRDLDEVQSRCGEGPCVDATRTDPLVTVPQASLDPRWPAYLPRAVERGVRSQVGLRLELGRRVLGVLTLHSTRADTIDPESLRLAQLFATHAAIALERRRTQDHLTEALATRKVIGQATGIIAERYRITGERAFQFLVRASQTSNTKLRDVAQGVVDSTDETYRRDRS